MAKTITVPLVYPRGELAAISVMMVGNWNRGEENRGGITREKNAAEKHALRGVV